MHRHLIVALVLAVTSSAAAEAPRPGSAGVELNVVWPFLGISEARFVIPVFTSGGQRGAVIAGLHVDYQQKDREDMGLFRNHAVKLGYRHYLWRGFHVEASANIGWIHVTNNPVDHMDYDELGLTAWVQVGYEWSLGANTYLNVRPTLGYLLSDQPWPNGIEPSFINGFVDANLGVRF